MIFYEDFEDPDVMTLSEGWDVANPSETFSLVSDVPAGAPAGSKSLLMDVSSAETTAVTL